MWAAFQLPDSSTWAARCGHVVVATESGKLVLLGGTGSRFHKDVWRSDDAGFGWYELPSPPWSARWGHTVTAVGNVLVLTGGVCSEGQYLQDTWRSEDLGTSWIQLPTPPWSARCNHSAVSIDNNVLVLAGGSAGGGVLFRDAWCSEDCGATWHPLPEPPWQARCGHAAAAVDGSMLLMGGLAVSGGGGGGGSGSSAPLLQDVWRSEDQGASWRQLAKAPWPACWGHVATAVDGNVVMVGGTGTGGLCSKDAWHSPDKGETWQRLPTPLWTARSRLGLAPLSGGVVLVGGVSSKGEYLQDVWRLEQPENVELMLSKFATCAVWIQSAEEEHNKLLGEVTHLRASLEHQQHREVEAVKRCESLEAELDQNRSRLAEKGDLEALSLPLLQRRLCAVRAMRTDRVTPTPPEFGMLAECLSKLPEPLNLRFSPADMHASTDATRLALQEKQVALKLAALLSKQAANVTTDCITVESATQDRDEAREHHIRRLREVHDALLKAACSEAPSDLADRMQIMEQFAAELEFAIDGARTFMVQVAPQISYRQNADRSLTHLTPQVLNADAMLLDRKKLVAAYNVFLKRCSPEINIANTENTIAAVQETLRTCGLKEPAVNTDEAANLLETRLHAASKAVEHETRFWKGLDPLKEFPFDQLLACGRQELGRLLQEVDMLGSLGGVVAAAAAELAEEEAALRPENNGGAALKELAKAAEAHLDARDRLQDTTLAVQRAQARGRAVEDVAPLEVAASEAKAVACQAEAAARAALAAVCRTLHHYPENAHDLAMALYLRENPAIDIVPLWFGGRTLNHFDEYSLLQSATRHRVYRASKDNRLFAVKEYALPDGDWQVAMQSCLSRAGLMHRARHPNFAEVIALFVDHGNHAFYVQMPFYEGESLDNWVVQRKPAQVELRHALYQALQALVHLHSLAIVHGSVRASNIFMDAGGTAYLSDFDLIGNTVPGLASSRQSLRTSVSGNPRTSVSFPDTAAFSAPELALTGSTAATDIFAFGETIFVSTELVSEDRGAYVDCAMLVRSLKAEHPEARPTGEVVLHDQFFAPIFVWKRSKFCACCVCGAERPLTEGIERNVFSANGASGYSSSTAAFLCIACLEDHVDRAPLYEKYVRQHSEGRVRWPVSIGVDGPAVCAAEFTDLELAQYLPAASFVQYSKQRITLLKQRLASEQDSVLLSQISAEIESLVSLAAAKGEVLAAHSHIMEEIIVSKCPRCGELINDFMGRFAISCSCCQCISCAWCGNDCSSQADPVAYVRACSEKPPEIESDYGTLEQFEAAQQRRRQKGLDAFLPTLDVSVRMGVLREMRSNAF